MPFQMFGVFVQDVVRSPKQRNGSLYRPSGGFRNTPFFHSRLSEPSWELFSPWAPHHHALPCCCSNESGISRAPTAAISPMAYFNLLSSTSSLSLHVFLLLIHCLLFMNLSSGVKPVSLKKPSIDNTFLVPSQSVCPACPLTLWILLAAE